MSFDTYVPKGRLIEEIGREQIVFMGVHGNSTTDQLLAAGLMGRIATVRKNQVAIGLEQVQFLMNLMEYFCCCEIC